MKRGFVIAATCLALSCGDDGGGGNGGQDGDGDGINVDGSSGTNADASNSGGDKLDVAAGTATDGDPCTPPDGEDEFSFIWIANSDEGTVSKIDTYTGTELGRYYASPSEGAGDPSRTSVNLEGDVAVAMREPGGITKIAALEDSCVDVNGNGTIETSTGPNNVLPWGSDECVLWYVDIPSGSQQNGPRPTAWDGATVLDPDTGCTYGDARVWVGYKHDDGHGVFWRIDGDDGTVLDMVDGPDYESRPYGGAVDADGNFWVTGWQHDPAIRIDGETLAVDNFGNPGVEFYGMALDATGDLWVADRSDAGAVAHFDAAAETWSVIADPGGKTRGIMIDEEGQAWIAGNNPCRLVQVDTETETVVNASIPLPGCGVPVGISIDIEGFVWVVDRDANQAYKVDPATTQVDLTVTGLVGPYTYSDMTGAGLRLVTNPPAG